VSYKNDQGIHSVEVTAETLFEAVAQAIVEFKEDKTITTVLRNSAFKCFGGRPSTQSACSAWWGGRSSATRRAGRSAAPGEGAEDVDG